jgi:hypothetical protein
VQRAELLCTAGAAAEGQQCFSQALQAYERSCALSDSSNGGLQHRQRRLPLLDELQACAG